MNLQFSPKNTVNLTIPNLITVYASLTLIGTKRVFIVTTMDELNSNNNPLILWKPADLLIYVSNAIEAHSSDDSIRSILTPPDFGVEIITRNETSAFMNITNNGIVGMSFILDLLTTVTKLGEARNERGELMYFLYAYTRLDFATNVEVMPLSEDISNNIIVLEFIFGQYCMFKNIDDEHAIDLHHNDEPLPNIVARGLESAGVGIRVLLKTSGRYLGNSIRYMGPALTQARLAVSQPGSAEAVIKPAAVERAKSVRSVSQSIHTGASTLTSTILYPVRWIGRQTAKFSSVRGLDASSHPVSKAALDTVCGLGNGVTNIFKGVTEMLAEVGSAVGECTMHHSATVNGQMYADQITRHYVEALGQISRAGYKLTNIASVGINGLMLDAVVEGATQYMSLYDYLIGPVLLQGFIELSQLPFYQPELFFAVLRPWSLSLYKSASDFTERPYKIIPTCMLDTLPQLHLPVAPVLNDTYNSSTSSSADVDEEPEESKDSDVIPNSSSNSITPSLSRRESFLESLKGSNRGRIELCTVDCSTYLLFPPEQHLNVWYEEIKAACTRVETVKLRRSGAEELASRRRLDLLPRSTLVVARVKELILSSSTAALGLLTEFDDLGEGVVPGSATGVRQGVAPTMTEAHSIGSEDAQSTTSDSLDGDVNESEFEAFFDDILEEYNTTYTNDRIRDVNLDSSHGVEISPEIVDDEAEGLTMRSHDSNSGFVSVARKVSRGEAQVDDVVTTQVVGARDTDFTADPGVRSDEIRATSTTDAQVSPLISNSYRSANTSGTMRATPSMMTRARHSFGRLMDPLVNSVITAVRIQITPLTYSGNAF